jgi:hypothetical protein
MSSCCRGPLAKRGQQKRACILLVTAAHQWGPSQASEGVLALSQPCPPPQLPCPSTSGRQHFLSPTLNLQKLGLPLARA